MSVLPSLHLFLRASQSLPSFLPSFQRGEVRQNGPVPRHPLPSYVLEGRSFGRFIWERLSVEQPNPDPELYSRIPASSPRPLWLVLGILDGSFPLHRHCNTEATTRRSAGLMWSSLSLSHALLRVATELPGLAIETGSETEERHVGKCVPPICDPYFMT